MKPREIAYLALLASLKEEGFIQDFLNSWIAKEDPPERGAALAREIAYGSARRALTLDYIADELNENKKLNLKRKERALLRQALYQHYFMERVPDYAIVNESVELAKKHCSIHFAKFLNAFLRRMKSIPMPEELSLYYSYPPYLVQSLIDDWGLEKAKEIMEAGNQPATVMARRREDHAFVQVENRHEIAQSSHYYIQNKTPWHLIQCLRGSKPPERILDLCSSPGGKLIALHDLYPNAALFANDVSEAKLEPLKENLAKYNIQATLSIGLGENYPTDQKFDLVILDVPCSNSGVLNKRPEARWRIGENELKQLNESQEKLLEHALKLSCGEIWYMTCSILKKENEAIIDKVGKKHQLKVRMMETVWPTSEGWDGGFGCAISLRV